MLVHEQTHLCQTVVQHFYHLAICIPLPAHKNAVHLPETSLSVYQACTQCITQLSSCWYAAGQLQVTAHRTLDVAGGVRILPRRGGSIAIACIHPMSAHTTHEIHEGRCRIAEVRMAYEPDMYDTDWDCEESHVIASHTICRPPCICRDHRMQRVSKARQVWTGTCDESTTTMAALVGLVGWLTGTPEGGRALCRGLSAGGSWPSRRLSSNTSSPAARRCCITNNEQHVHSCQ